MVSNIDGTLAALADPTRRWVVEQLRSGPRRAGDLAAASGMSAPAMSRHLRVLRRKGLVEQQEVEQDARVRLYVLRPNPFSALRNWLVEVEEFWDQKLQSFKTHAERRSKRPRS